MLGAAALGRGRSASLANPLSPQAKILEGFVAREAEMVACLSRSERSTFFQLLNKLIDNSTAWAKPY